MPSAVAGAAPILTAGFVHGGVKSLLWVVAIGIGFFGPLFVDLSGWRVHPAHFVERHELGLFGPELYTSSFEDLGFAVREDHDGLFGRGMYVAHDRR